MNPVRFILISAALILAYCSSSDQIAENKTLLESISPDRPFTDSRFEEINGIKIHYRYRLQKNISYSSKVLMIHGLAGSTFSFRHTAEFLNKNGILAVSADLPAFGYSSRNLGLNHSSSSRAALISKLMKNIDVSLPAKAGTMKWNLLGHSMGGRTVLTLASQMEMNERIQNLILIAPAVYSKGSSVGKFLLRFSLFRYTAESFMADSYLNRKSFQKLLSSAYGRTPEPEETDGYLAPLLNPDSEKAFFDSLISSDDAVPDFSKIQNPVLILHGKKDSWILPEESEKLNQEIKGSKLKFIENSGHCPMETHPDSVNQFILNFIKSR